MSERTLVFLGIADLPRRLHQVLLINVVPARKISFVRNTTFARGNLPLVSDGKHPRFRDDITKIGTIETIRQLCSNRSIAERHRTGKIKP